MPRRRRLLFPRLWPGVRRTFRVLLSAPAGLQFVLIAILAVGLWAAGNWVYHAVRKPTELLFPVSDALAKTPAETWREYGPLFRRYATAVITPEFLAALAQIESAGNPLAQTYWRWNLSWHPLEVYRPASSAVGMYQITDGTFAQTRRECRQDLARPGGDSSPAPGSCWLDSLYSRVVPGEAIELTATLLDGAVAGTLRRQRISRATQQQKHDLAAVIHLCGAGAGEGYARRGFRLTPGQRCGDHDVRGYLARVNAMKRQFARLAGES
ncbi:MAG TPA: transglycosylase SLT domain-containing protein [Burkholderiales bacterium]|nr:transglycosylase SLT domain-containing protein [Burkholderiales bacterium]